MTALSYPVIALPMMGITLFIFWKLFREITHKTSLTDGRTHQTIELYGIPPTRTNRHESILALCLGTMTWGEQNDPHRMPIDNSTAPSMAGINFIDTAEMYPGSALAPKPKGRTESVASAPGPEWKKYRSQYHSRQQGGRDRACPTSEVPRIVALAGRPFARPSTIP